MTDEQKTNLAVNLRRLCGHYRSLAEVCRRIGMNRQQFNKYLAGATAPSPHSLKRICDFFGVEEAEITLPPQQFTTEVLQRPLAHLPLTQPQIEVSRILEQMPDSREQLTRYCGYYYFYSRSPSSPNTIFRSLSVIFQEGGYTYEKTVDRFLNPEQPQTGPGSYWKARGIVLHAGDRIFIHSVMVSQPYSASLAVLYPSHRGRLHLLSGLMLSVSSGPGRQAFASRIAYEYLGPKVDLRKVFRRCGVYDLDSKQLNPAIVSRIRNFVEPWEESLSAMAY